LLVWILGGAFSLAGAGVYTELGERFPEAGGIYRYLERSYGPLPAFLYGWACFWAIMSGGIAALAVGAAQYAIGFLTSLCPWWKPEGTLEVRGAAVGGILLLSALKAFFPNTSWVAHHALTTLKVVAGAAFALALLARGSWPLEQTVALSPSGWLAGLGPALLAVLWTFDGFYAATFRTESFDNPEKTVGRSIHFGVALLLALYLLLQLGYLAALPVSELANTQRPAEAAALRALGPMWSQSVSLIVAVSAFGCLSSTILYSAWIYPAMAQDGVFLKYMAQLSRFGTPARAIWSQSAWACLLAATGSFREIYTYVVFAVMVFHLAAAIAVLRLRPKPSRSRQMGAFLFAAASVSLLTDTLQNQATESAFGLAILAAGVPAFWFWKQRGFAR
jgi:APA family basic amino acid/polyamine antiporter